MTRRHFILVASVLLILAATLVFCCYALVSRHPKWTAYRSTQFGDRRVSFLIVRLPFSLREYALEADIEHPKTVREWREELGAEIVFNGSYFNEDGAPSGYWKLGKGESVVPWPTLEEQADPHGYSFSLSLGGGGLHLRYLPSAPTEEPINEMFLSFPTLIADRKPLVEEDSGQLARRTAVAEDSSGQDYVIVTEEGTLSLYEFSRWLSEQPEQFVIAGNLDGGPSTGISIENGRNDIDVRSSQVPNVVAVWDADD